LNGAAVEMNKRALAWGRLAVHDQDAVANAMRPLARPVPAVRTSADLTETRAQFLIGYQNAAYAQRYRDIVADVGRVESARVPNRSGLQDAVAANLFK